MNGKLCSGVCDARHATNADRERFCKRLAVLCTPKIDVVMTSDVGADSKREI